MRRMRSGACQVTPEAVDGATVLGIWAHPDDESYLSGGLMVRAARGGGLVRCVHATVGEGGTPDPVAWPPDRLAVLRRRELASALAALGVAGHDVLDLPDGGLASVEDQPVVSVLVAEIRALRPDLVVTFGPEGVTGHPDHRTVSRWATDAWRQAGMGRLLHAVTAQSFVDRFRSVHELIGMADAFHGVVPDASLDLILTLTGDELTAKRAALAAHDSQTAPLASAMGESSYLAWLEIETFREIR